MSAALSVDGVPSLVDLLLAEQRTLRAVDEFAAWHETGDRHGGRFESLIPSARPAEGQQFAFAVDLDACTGCKACVTACHSMNGLEVGETWRKVGEVEARFDAGIEARGALAHRQTVTTACHHCEEPACLEGCPVQAYDKDPITGIVVHLDDQCIGCRYCQLMCPYDVPQFSERLGIVRKCDMCHGRLAAGEAPACVQGCPNEAISIEIVDVAGPLEPHVQVSQAMLLPVVQGGMPLSALTRPTTRYRTARAQPDAWIAVEGFAPTPSEAHTPLAGMLVLTQASIGTLLFDSLFAAIFPSSYGADARLVALIAAVLLGFAGLGVSVLHLGRPIWAFRAFLGLRTSWMSREIVVFGGFAAALGAALVSSTIGLWASEGAGDGSGADGTLIGIAAGLAQLAPLARFGALASGLVGLFCSVQIYAVTGRPLWRADRTALRFGATVVLLGAASTAIAWSLGALLGAGPQREAGRLVFVPLLVLLCAAVMKLQWEHGRLVHGIPGHDEVALARTRTLLARALAPMQRVRRGLGFAFGIALPVVCIALALTFDGGLLQTSAVLLCGLGCLAGEVVERDLFFRSEAMRGMPGST